MTEAEIRAQVQKNRLKTKPERDAKKAAKKLKDDIARDKKRIEKRLKDIKILQKSLRNKPENAKMIAQLKNEIELIRNRRKENKSLGDDKSDKKKDKKDFKDMTKNQPNVKVGESVDDAGPVGEMQRDRASEKAKSLMSKNKKAGPSADDKKKGPSAGDIMGGARGPSGPLGGKLDDEKKKKKKSMLGKNRVGAGKGRYGDNRRTGNYYGQR